ncbi:Gfo/Idh/MocA family oxidoreductase [Streptomyces angustmyceticus]|uniref:Inositol 2-dehydrogenase n=1 Tax=Streptomyces angustmyceticus TaxID=285578 RepID=A0A5J4LE04_9ACTN|nr:Gfo/Idh/MocA family oxidoreductase [Streptomyces angustmyceticus]UAL69130.1 Gfo/Idh/MocA family oxidoreductase [Streptomyces angustmyceticus]GES29616.1 inositol 2-dehydrogenase [Streptomyces angustmyceticus]
MTSHETLGVAVIGTGRMGADHVRRINEVISGARVAAVVDIDADRIKRLADGITGCTPYTDPAAALDDPAVDAVLIASPGPAHEAALLAAFARDLPVLCEKPLTPDAASALRVLEAEQALGHRRVQVGFMRRYDADYRSLKSLLEQGAHGRPLMLHNKHRNADTPPGFTNAMMINDSVVHEIDVTRWLLEEEITAVRVLRPAPTGNAPEGLSDPQLVLFETAGGQVVDTEIFVNCGFGYQVGCEAVCENGTARIGDDHGVFSNAAGRWGGAVPPGFVERFEEAYDRQVQHWVNATRRGEVEGPSCWDGYAAAAVCEAGVRAQTTGERVPVELIERPALYR